jgi:hypothetical protein
MAILCAGALVAACGDEPRDARTAPETAPVTSPSADTYTREPAPHTTDPVRLVRDLRKAGLFQGGGSARAVAARVQKEHHREWGEPLELKTLYDELFFAKYDRDRVWWDDLEADALEGNELYVELFEDWSRISRGAFRPRAVEERWEDELGPFTIEFQLDGRPRRVEGVDLEGWIDPCVLLTGVNPLIRGSGRQFVMPEPFDQTAFVLALTANERAILEEYGWSFLDPDDVYAAYEEIADTAEGSQRGGCRS